MSCKGCTKRHVGCHSKCEDYKEMRRQIDEFKEKIFAEKDKDRILNNREYERIEYAKKVKGAKK